MASRFGQRRVGRQLHPPGPSEHRDPSPNRSLYSSATWWNDREEQPDNGETLREHLKTMDDHVARLQDMLKSERTKCSRLQLRCNQQEAELRRREQNINRLKERLSLTDRYKDKVPSIKVLNILPSARVKREQPPSAANNHEDGAVRLMLERREAELREAMKLRHSLTSVLHALRCDMEQTLSELEGSKDEAHYLDKRLDQAERALGDHVTGGVVQSWRKVQKRLGTFICEGPTEVGTDHDKLMAQLENELKESQQLVKLQQQLLQDSIESPVPSELTDSYFLEEWDRLQVLRAELEHQRQTFEKERQAFTDAAIRLSHERCDFEQQKASLLKQQYLCHSPVLGKETQANNKRESGLDFSGIRPLNTSMPTTPSTAVSKREAESKVCVQTPSTPELYSALNLSYNRCRGTEDMWNRTNPAPRLDWSL